MSSHCGCPECVASAESHGPTCGCRTCNPNGTFFEDPLMPDGFCQVGVYAERIRAEQDRLHEELQLASEQGRLVGQYADRYKRMLQELIALAHHPADGALLNHLMHIRDTLNAEDNHG